MDMIQLFLRAVSSNQEGLNSFSSSWRFDESNGWWDLIPVKIARIIYYSEVTEMLDKEVLLEVVEHQWIGSSTINMWIQYVIRFLIIITVSYISIINCPGRCLCRYLHDKVIVPGENVSFAFINPDSISVVDAKPMWNKEDIQCHLLTCASERKLFFVPINVG